MLNALPGVVGGSKTRMFQRVNADVDAGKDPHLPTQVTCFVAGTYMLYTEFRKTAKLS